MKFQDFSFQGSKVTVGTTRNIFKKDNPRLNEVIVVICRYRKSFKFVLVKPTRLHKI